MVKAAAHGDDRCTHGRGFMVTQKKVRELSCVCRNEGGGAVSYHAG